MSLIQEFKKFRKEKIEYFYAVSLILIYLIWKIVKTYISPNITLLSDFGDFFNESLAYLYVRFIAFVLNILAIDYTTFMTQTSYGEYITIAISGAAGIYVAYHCLGITASLIYSIILFLLPGSKKRKFFFLFFGLISMFFANSIRLISLVFLDKYSTRFWVELNHSLFFVILFYSLLFMFHFLYLKPVLFVKENTSK